MDTFREALEIALQHHQAGQLAEAERIYQQILAVKPAHAGAMHLLGVIAHQVGQHQVAIDYIEQAIRLNESDAAFHNNLGEAYRALGKIPEAIACYRRAVALRPDYIEASNNLGAAFYYQGKLDDAVACYRRALELQPDYAKVHSNLGLVFKQQGKLDAAISCFRLALDLEPDYAEAHNNLGTAFNDQKQLEAAVACYQRALVLKPDFAEAHNNLGVAFKNQAKLDEAVACYRRALELKPDYVDAHYNLGTAFNDQNQLERAVACYRRALDLRPTFVEAYNNLGAILCDQGRLADAATCYRRALEQKPDFAEVHHNLGNVFLRQSNFNDAVTCYRQALKLKPDYSEAHSNLSLSLLYYSCASADELRESHADFNRQFALPLQATLQPHPNHRNSFRRLRIGYVSPNFRDHVVGRNVWLLFREHDHDQFELFAYANSFQRDEWTSRFQSVVDGWRQAKSLNDESLAQQIRDDRIDILVDLALHTAHNRLLAFARKPAPVQVTFAGYPGTTGLTAIDYRLTDPYLDPPGLFDDCYSEQSIRLPATWWCYDPLSDEPAVNPLPAQESGAVTFGCLNDFCKVNEPTLKLWAQVLRALPRSRLLLLAPEGTARQQALTVLGQEGIPVQRLSFVAKQSRPQYLEQYHQIDIGLDTLPYNGHTTSLDSYWMGVPVVTLVGQTVVGRAGLSQLSNLGLPELIAQTPDQFVQIATELALDLPRLAQLRQGLRQRMQNSPLMDAKGFARGIEDAYRTIWQRWCAQPIS